MKKIIDLEKNDKEEYHLDAPPNLSTLIRTKTLKFIAKTGLLLKKIIDLVKNSTGEYSLNAPSDPSTLVRKRTLKFIVAGVVCLFLSLLLTTIFFPMNQSTYALNNQPATKQPATQNKAHNLIAKENRASVEESNRPRQQPERSSKFKHHHPHKDH